MMRNVICWFENLREKSCPRVEQEKGRCIEKWRASYRSLYVFFFFGKPNQLEEYPFSISLCNDLFVRLHFNTPSRFKTSLLLRTQWKYIRSLTCSYRYLKRQHWYFVCYARLVATIRGSSISVDLECLIFLQNAGKPSMWKKRTRPPKHRIALIFLEKTHPFTTICLETR